MPASPWRIGGETWKSSLDLATMISKAYRHYRVGGGRADGAKYLPGHGIVHVHTTSHYLLVVYADPAAGSQRCGYLLDSILMQLTISLTL